MGFFLTIMAIRLQAVLSGLKAQGAPIEKLTASEISELVHACEAVDNPWSDANAELLEQPVRCGNTYLWPLTAGAQIWLAEYAERWWRKGSLMHRWATVYALHNARDADAFTKCTEKGKARNAIVKTMLRFCVYREELASAIAQCFGIHSGYCPGKRRRVDNEQAADFARIVALLEVQSGMSAEVWLWDKSLVTALRTYQRMRAMGSALGGDVSKLTFELDEALSNLGRLKAKIIKRVRDEQSA